MLETALMTLRDVSPDRRIGSLSGHSGHGRICYWLNPAVREPTTAIAARGKLKSSDGLRSKFLREHKVLADARHIGPVTHELSDQPRHLLLYRAVERGLITSPDEWRGQSGSRTATPF